MYIKTVTEDRKEIFTILKAFTAGKYEAEKLVYNHVSFTPIENSRYNVCEYEDELFFTKSGRLWLNRLTETFTSDFEKEKLQEFRKKINENCTLEKKDFAKKVQIDIDMPVDYITMDLIHQLSVLEPFGKENKKPLFAHRKLKVERVNVFGKNRNVIKLALKSSQGTRIDGMIFEDEDEFREKMGTSKYITCTYYPVINEYQGYKSLQINIQNYFFVEE